MPRKKPEELKSAAPAASKPAAAPAPAPAPAAPVIHQPAPQPAPMPAGYHPADSNGDGKVSAEEEKMYLEFKRKELEDQDAMRDAQRKMAWFSLAGMLLYPFAVVLAVLLKLDQVFYFFLIHSELKKHLFHQTIEGFYFFLVQEGIYFS